MFRIWFERAMPQHVVPLLEGVAEPLGPAAASPGDPYAELEAADAIIASIHTYGPEVMDRGPGVRVISRTGIGFDKVDLEAATERGILVCNAPDGPTISTAEHTLMLMLAVAKKLSEAQEELRAGAHDVFARHKGVELHGQTLGLVGLGRIGRHVAAVAAAMGMTVQAHDPYAAPQTAVPMVDELDELLASSDVVSLHLPLTDETRLLIDAARIARMRAGAILVNTARGGLVDTDALLAALEAGRLAGAGLDVSEPEPLPPDHPLLHRHDAVVTPHVAAATAAGKQRIYHQAVTQALQVLREERPSHLVNPDAWDRRRRARTA